jgi:hypothetical protein
VLPKDYNANFVQAQFLASSPLLQEISQPESPIIARLEKIESTEACITEAFASSLGRSPDTVELKQVTNLLKTASATTEGRIKAIRNLLHALITSPEFLISPR